LVKQVLNKVASVVVPGMLVPLDGLAINIYAIFGC
jgi:hypothetical protein